VNTDHPIASDTPAASPRAISARAGELGAAAALFATGLFFTLQSLNLPFGTIDLPGPGFFPFALGVALSLAAAFIALPALTTHAPGVAVDIVHRDILIVFAALLLTCIAFEPLGAYATLGALTALLLWQVAHAQPLVALGAAAAGMVAVWGVFKVLLGVQFPAGPF
jgi:hypothetical protein